MAGSEWQHNIGMNCASRMNWLRRELTVGHELRHRRMKDYPKNTDENKSPVTTEVSRAASATGTAKRVFLMPTLPKYSASE